LKEKNFKHLAITALLICLAALLVFFFAWVTEAEAQSRPLGVLISVEIRPFMLMVEGLEAQLDIPVCRIFLDEKDQPFSRDPLYQKLEPTEFCAMVAVGPRALSYLHLRKWPTPLIYGMVLDPKRIIGADHPYCGVSLNIFSLSQMSDIHRTFPEVRRMGVLYDPANNQQWFDSAIQMARLNRLTLVPLPVKRQADISVLLDKTKPAVDAILFIPDATVISRTIIQYVLKQSILHRIPTIGYNRFFHESGAAISFVVDYRAIGEQVAALVDAVLQGRPCGSRVPSYTVLLNRKVVRKIQVKLAKSLPDFIVEE